VTGYGCRVEAKVVAGRISEQLHMTTHDNAIEVYKAMEGRGKGNERERREEEMKRERAKQKE